MVLGDLQVMYTAKGKFLRHHLRNVDVKVSNKGKFISRSGNVILGSNAVDFSQRDLSSCRIIHNFSGW